MSNFAVIIAAGSGTRMGQDIPKQFLNIEDKPVIIYTLEAFEKHPNIDGIIVVCLKGWEEILKAYSKQFNITKLKDIAPGGSCGQESIKNGLELAKKYYKDDDIVLVHDGNRPLVSQDIISDNIASCMRYGNAITAIPCAEAVLETDNQEDSISQIDRSRLKRTQTPHAFRFADLLEAHKEAKEKGITNSVASCTLFIELGKKVYFSKGSEKNIKLTVPEDLEMFKALLKTKKEDWIK